MSASTPSLVALLLTSLWSCVSPSRILLLPVPYHSHITELLHIGEALTDRGHDVHLLLPSHLRGLEKFTSSKAATLMTYDPSHYDYLQHTPEQSMALFAQALRSTPVEMFRAAPDVEGTCYNLLDNKELEERIVALKFDLFIVDGFPMARCNMILPYRLDIPYVSVTTTYEPWLLRNPALPSFVPFPMHHPPLTPKMTFWERLSNAWQLFDWTYHAPDIPCLDDAMVPRFAPNKPAVSINYLAGQSLLWLFDTDDVIDYPRPMMPNEINIGGLSTKPAKPLPEDLDRFIASASGGTILAAFGSTSIIPENYLHKMVEAFKMLPRDVHVVFRWGPTFQRPDVPDNILLLDLVPQSDVLGHNNTKLFLTHSGANSQFEGLYHGVPMINFPSFADQPYNAKRADFHGFSETMHIATFTTEDLYHTILKVLTTPSYGEKIRHACAVFRSRGTPRDRAAFWVEHVLRFGGQHLRAHGLDMAPYQFLMLDILVPATAILVALLYASAKLTGNLCKAKSS